jgi:hypothetical protein
VSGRDTALSKLSRTSPAINVQIKCVTGGNTGSLCRPAEFTNSGQDSSGELHVLYMLLRAIPAAAAAHWSCSDVHAGVAAAGKDDGLPPDESGSEAEGCEDDDDDDGLPPLEQNTNRRVIVHLVSDSEEEEGEED